MRGSIQWVALAEEPRGQLAKDLELFSAGSVDEIRARGALPDAFAITADDDQLPTIAAELRDRAFRVYPKPIPQRPIHRADMRPSEDARVPEGPTPDFSGYQGYLLDSPVGLDIARAWQVRGGKGQGVSIVDVEGSWRPSHEALTTRHVTHLGPPYDPVADFSHGNAVIGMIAAPHTGSGIRGIAPDARMRVCCDYLRVNSSRIASNALYDAADGLDEGDILIVEIHYPGPRSAEPWEYDRDAFGYLPAEYFPDDFLAIEYATSRGIIVVAAAGNGYQDLDDSQYDERPEWFPTWWSNPLRRLRDSRAILVGAGACPPGTNGIDEGADRSRLDFSNWGSMIDAQGWGNAVATLGYGDLQGTAFDVRTLDRWYTAAFNGTSSATPCVAGALACVQGILRDRGNPLLTPTTARALLRETGAPQTDAHGRPATQRIGNRPSVVQMLARLGIQI